MKKYCFALDLIDDKELIDAYDLHHQQVWPEILESIRSAGILQMQIYRTGNRLFMIMDTTDEFSFEVKAEMDSTNEKVAEWEKLMWKYQQPLPFAKPGDKWVMMQQIFELE